ncbi:MAG: hypothetical protein M1500_01715 [Candidatus Marsarchaeota archaeon]|nr:hypothetical protein [Candidatus Marsarchaeota archaeon]MCL5112414.1 hypothetical protein [Candidatus Marsarchaeota archaeon]
MRGADAVTLSRLPIIVAIVYLILVKFNPIVTILLIILVTVLDAVDGMVAVWSSSGGRIGFIEYTSAALGNPNMKALVKKYKQGISKTAKHGPRMDIAGDRIIEYLLWIVFTYTGIVPLAVLIIIVIRHSFADALMGARGTSSKMKTRAASWLYSSNASRFAINVLKLVTFSYLVLVYVSGYSLLVGYVLIGLLAAFIVVRGAAEIYESIG